jgi:hypothetical protein
MIWNRDNAAVVTLATGECIQKGLSILITRASKKGLLSHSDALQQLDWFTILCFAVNNEKR